MSAMTLWQHPLFPTFQLLKLWTSSLRIPEHLYSTKTQISLFERFMLSYQPVHGPVLTTYLLKRFLKKAQFCITNKQAHQTPL